MHRTLLVTFSIACLSASVGLGAQPAAASIIIADTLPVSPGYSVLGYDPDASGNPPGLPPGRAYEFRTPSESLELDYIEVALNMFDGASEIDIAIHGSEPYINGRIRPAAAIESFHLSGIVGSGTSVVRLDSLLGPLLAADESYFVSVSTTEVTNLQRIRWASGNPSDTGFTRAFMYEDYSWGVYTFDTYPRAAFRVAAVPEPSTGLLLLGGLAVLSRKARRATCR
jgi:hypothetical protein